MSSVVETRKTSPKQNPAPTLKDSAKEEVPRRHQHSRQLCLVDSQKPKASATDYPGQSPPEPPVADARNPHHYAFHRYLWPFHSQDAVGDVPMECHLLLHNRSW